MESRISKRSNNKIKNDTSEGISKSKLINRLLIAFILITLVFGLLFYIGLSPKDFFYSIVPVTISKTNPPKYTYAFYGEGDYKIRKPMAIMIKNNQLYITDAEANKVWVFSKDGKYKSSFGKQGGNKGELNFPYGIATDDKNQIYISDMKNHRIQIFDLSGNFIRFFPNNEKNDTLFGSPAQLVIKNNLLYVVDIMKSKVMVFDLNGKKKLEFGTQGTEKEQFKYPNGIEVDNEGNIYVADTGNNRIQIFDKAGKLKKVANGSTDSDTITFASPRGLKIVNNNVLIIVNSLSSQIWNTDLFGQPYYRFGKKGDENEEFNFPNGVEVDKNRIYITDSQNHGIKVYSF